MANTQHLAKLNVYICRENKRSCTNIEVISFQKSEEFRQSEHIRKLRAWPILDLQYVAQLRCLYEKL